jgi:peptidoglycan/LPS O-acetylase OafA/YrhL
LLSLLFVISFVTNIALSINNITADFYWPVSRFWELLAGAAVAIPSGLRVSALARSWISCVGLAALVSSVALFGTDMRFPGWLAFLPVAGTSAIIFAGPHAIANRSVLANARVVSVGLISYPLYLWHWPLMSFAYILCSGKAPTPLLSTALVAVSFLLAWATYRFVESPIRYGPHPQRRTILVGACVAAVGIGGLLAWLCDGFPGRFPGLNMKNISEAVADADFRPTKGMQVINHNHTLVTHIGAGSTKVVLAGDSVLFHHGPRI